MATKTKAAKLPGGGASYLDCGLGGHKGRTQNAEVVIPVGFCGFVEDWIGVDWDGLGGDLGGDWE